MKQPYYHQKILGVLCLNTEIFRRRFLCNFPNILVVIKCEEQNLRKLQVTKYKNSKCLRRMERLSRNFKPFSRCRIFQPITAPSNNYFTEKGRWVPLQLDFLVFEPGNEIYVIEAIEAVRLNRKIKKGGEVCRNVSVVFIGLLCSWQKEADRTLL